MSGEFCRRLRCRITCTFSQRQPAGMRPSAISQNGLNAGFNEAYRTSNCHQPVREGVATDWRWQEGCFDRLLRSDESLSEKWEYLRQNPVRAGLVKHLEDWPYQFEFNA